MSDILRPHRLQHARPLFPSLAPRVYSNSGEGNGNLLQSLLPVKFHGQRSLVGYSPWGCKESDTTEQIHSHLSIESVMPSNHLILCHPLLLQPLIFPSIKVFSNESALRIRWSKYWSFSFNISPAKEHSELIFRMGWLELLLVQGLSRVFTNTRVQKHQFFSTQLSLSPTLTSIHGY